MKRLRLLRMGTSGSCRALMEKFGNLDLYAQDIVPGLTELSVRLCPFGTFSGRRILRPDLIVHEMAGGSRPTKWPALVRDVTRLVRRYGINVAHSNDPFQWGLAMLVAARTQGVPFCVSVHTDYERGAALDTGAAPRLLFSRRPARFAETLVYRHAGLVLPIRRSLADRVRRRGCPREKIRLFPHSVSERTFTGEDAFDVRRRYNLPPSARLVVHAGRLEKDNYADDIAAVAGRLVQSDPDVHVIVCGSGAQQEAMARGVRAAGGADRIRFLGFVPQEEVLAWRRQGDVNLCLRAGFSLIEACAAGTPVVAYDVDWHRELVRNGETGFLVPEHDVAGVAERVQRLLAHPDEALRMGDSARRLARRRHSPANVARQKASIYRELLQKKSRHGPR